MAGYFWATLWLLLTSVVGRTGAQTPSLASANCDVISCVKPVKCRQLEQCLLVAQKNGCNPKLITFAAYEAYRLCLFGPGGLCSLSPLISCYERHLVKHTETRLPVGTNLQPDAVTGFIRVLLEDAANARFQQQQCRIPVSAVQRMTRCVLEVSGELEKNCASAMPIATESYFLNENPKAALNPSIITLTELLTSYIGTCSSVGEWMTWTNNNHPSTQNPDDIEVTSVTCPTGQALGIQCILDDQVKQTCGQGNCSTTKQKVQCGVRIGGARCFSQQQDRSSTGPCQCCDYKVRYRCPITVPITVSPTYGPETGGTNITVIGPNITTSDRIFLEKQECPAKERSRNRVVCRVPALQNGLGSKTEQVVRVFISQGGKRQSQQNLTTPIIQSSDTKATFTYKAGFTVTTVYNLNTPLSGGTNVTLEGTHFSSITNPLMIITVYHKVSGRVVTWTFQSTCWVVSDVKIQCPVPSLINPIEFIPNNSNPRLDNPNQEPVFARKRRSPMDLNVRAPHIRERHKRSTCDRTDGDDANPINDNDELRYRVTFDLDGNQVTGDYNMDVFTDPEIERFEEDPTCRVYQRWLLATDTEMEISGFGLAGGLSCADYTVWVGGGHCIMQDLFMNRIICNPPDSTPEPGDGDVDGRLTVKVVIGNGNLQFGVGCLRYESMLLENTWGRLGLIIGLAAAALLVLLVAICCCCHFRRKSDRD